MKLRTEGSLFVSFRWCSFFTPIIVLYVRAVGSKNEVVRSNVVREAHWKISPYQLSISMLHDFGASATTRSQRKGRFLVFRKDRCLVFAVKKCYSQVVLRAFC